MTLPLDDRAVISQIVGGDGEALAALVNRHRPTIVRHLRRYPIAPDARERVTHEVVTDMVRKLSTYSGDVTFTRWVYRVTANAAFQHLKTQRTV